MKRKLNYKKIIILIIILLLILVLILAKVIKKSTDSENHDAENAIDTRTEQQKEDEKIAKLKKVSESERVKIYIGTYFKYIENGDLTSSYNLLYPDFKNNYFKTQDEYEKYVKEKYYPEMMLIDYKTITTQGKYYMVTVEIIDMINNFNDEVHSEDITLIEEDYNVFYISFKL